MSTMRTRSRALGSWVRVVLLGLCLGAPVHGEDGVESAWRQRLSVAQQLLDSARTRSETARNTYQDWRQRKYPRGTRKKELILEIDAAEKAEAEAEARFAGLLDQARQGGANAGLLREFE
ncbi:MAG: hypothetical protein ABFS46_08235 [Myxococcota bacterium]